MRHRRRDLSRSISTLALASMAACSGGGGAPPTVPTPAAVTPAPAPTPMPTYEPVDGRRTALETWTPPQAAVATSATAAISATCKSRGTRRWLLFGWDGGDWNLILPLIDAGELPNLARLMRAGTYAELYTIQPTVSPVVWTTIATGRSPADHGILGFTRQQSNELTTSSDRRTRAIWNLVDTAGGTTVAIGYHNTFPVEPIRGVMVSNYMVQTYFAEELATGGIEDLREGLVYPPELLETVLALERQIGDQLPARIDRFVDGVTDQERGEWRQPIGVRDNGAYWREGIRRGYIFDGLNARLARRLLPELHPDLALVHFQSVDWASHRFLYFHEPERYRDAGWSDELRATMIDLAPRYSRTLTAFYQYVDQHLGEVLTAAGDDTAVLVVSDHGFSPSEQANISGEHFDSPPGIFVAAGPGIRSAGRHAGISVYDVFPTLAAGLGLALSDQLPGRVLDDLFCPDAVPEPQRVASYEVSGEDRRGDVAIPADAEEAIREQLRSLGYIQ